ncbi:MAG: ROK family protein [Bauldia sp.]|nr:ROK family protein [Bauldia sp.]MCB1504015.1 ROK family protein [Hyphomicrobiaceae bacterium]
MALSTDTPTIGIDLGGTKIEAIALHPDGRTLASIRVPTPRQDYEATLQAIAALAVQIEQRAQFDTPASVGVAMPGSISPSTGLVQNANSTWLNGRPFASDLALALGGRPLRTANDANCFALSEAVDGAAAGAHSMFGVILGTGCGGGIVYKGELIDGPRGIGGEWGHNPLPWPDPSELPGPACWCGLNGCLETWISGPALAADHARCYGEALSAEEIVALAKQPSGARSSTARATLQRHAERLARGLAHVVNLLDPAVIVLGGGLSNMAHLYDQVPLLMRKWIFAVDRRVDIRAPRYGDASGARGAARLWQQARPSSQ